MQQTGYVAADILQENEDLRTRLAAAEAALRALRGGDVDGLTAAGAADLQVSAPEVSVHPQTEAALRERQNFLNRILDVLPGVLYVFDLDENRVVFVKNTAEQT